MESIWLLERSKDSCAGNNLGKHFFIALTPGIRQYTTIILQRLYVISPTIKVDDKLCSSGIKRYNSRSQGAKKIIPTLIRALKLYEPKLVNISLILTPPIIGKKCLLDVGKHRQICWHCKEGFRIQLNQNQNHKVRREVNLHNFAHSGKECRVFYQES